jgi:hypothetical protein
MAFHPMKPETIQRRAEYRVKETAERHALLIRRLREKAAADPDGIWQDLLDTNHPSE